LLTREPGGTAVGERIRSLLLDPGGPALDLRAEVLLFLADRAAHVALVIAPALAAGRDVVCDRFAGSTIAYQGHGRGLPPEELALLSSWAAAGLEPDRVILLRVGVEVASARRAARGGADRIEGEGAAFFSRVEAGYAALAGADPARWRVVDGVGPVEDVAARVWVASVD
jgi:dTMP kinase